MANPEAERRRPEKGGWELESRGRRVKEVRPRWCVLCAAAILESGSCDSGGVRPKREEPVRWERARHVGAVGGVKPARAPGEGARRASPGGRRGSRGRGTGWRWAQGWEVNLRCGWGSSFVPLGSVRATERKMLNGGCKCRVGKCE